jgi:hypothetical protein
MRLSTSGTRNGGNMSDLESRRRTAADVIVHEAFVIIEAAQWHKKRPRTKELVLIAKSLWTITQKLVTLRRLYAED